MIPPSLPSLLVLVVAAIAVGWPAEARTECAPSAWQNVNLVRSGLGLVYLRTHERIRWFDPAFKSFVEWSVTAPSVTCGTNFTAPEEYGPAVILPLSESAYAVVERRGWFLKLKFKM